MRSQALVAQQEPRRVSCCIYRRLCAATRLPASHSHEALERAAFVRLLLSRVGFGRDQQKSSHQVLDLETASRGLRPDYQIDEVGSSSFQRHLYEVLLDKAGKSNHLMVRSGRCCETGARLTRHLSMQVSVTICLQNLRCLTPKGESMYTIRKRGELSWQH